MYLEDCRDCLFASSMGKTGKTKKNKNADSADTMDATAASFEAMNLKTSSADVFTAEERAAFAEVSWGLSASSALNGTLGPWGTSMCSSG
jgi:hypothetical protein